MLDIPILDSRTSTACTGSAWMVANNTALQELGGGGSATDDDQRPLAVDPQTLMPVSEGGVVLTPGHVHHALRELAGVHQSEVAARFPILEQSLPLFG